MFGTKYTKGAWFVEVVNDSPPHSIGPFRDISSFDKLCILVFL